MAAVTPFMSFLRPMGLPRPATVRQFMHFSTSTPCLAAREGTSSDDKDLTHMRISLTSASRPQPRRLAHCARLIPSAQHQIAAPAQGVQSLTPHKLPQSRAPLPYPRRITPQADRRETHPGSRQDASAAPLRAQSAILCHQDAQQPLAHLHSAKGRRKQARDEGEEGGRKVGGAEG